MSELLATNKLVASALLIVFVLGARALVIWHLRKLPDDESQRPRRLLNTAKNTFNFLMALGLVVIWLSELRFVALSIATFAVALVIASREYIQCLLGSFYMATTRAFTIGDWIRISGQYGEVVRSDWLTTTLLEVDVEGGSYGYTGRTLYIPNNQFVSGTVQNLNYMRRYIAHSFVMVRDDDVLDMQSLKDFVLQKATEYCEPFNDVAQRYGSVVQKRMGVDLFGPEPSVRLATTNLGKNQLTITVFCPTNEAVAIEQKLCADIMGFWRAASLEAEAKAKSMAQKAHEAAEAK